MGEGGNSKRAPRNTLVNSKHSRKKIKKLEAVRRASVYFGMGGRKKAAGVYKVSQRGGDERVLPHIFKRASHGQG